MHKPVLLVAFLIGSLATSLPASAPQVVPARVGLVLIGATPQGFVVATDGSSLNADGRVSQEQKLFRAGKQGALALAGTVSVQDPLGKRVREEVNLARIAGAWLAVHPDVDIQTADREVNASIAAAMNRFLSTREYRAENGGFKFAVIVVGYIDGKPTVVSTRYFMPGLRGKPMRTERAVASAKAGDIWIFSQSSVPLELLIGKSNTLEQFQSDPAIKKFRPTPSADLTTQDYLAFFDRVLRASESEQGKKLDGKRAIVVPPNRFAYVVLKDGFAWSTPSN